MMENSNRKWLMIALFPVLNAAMGMTWYGVFSAPWMEGHGLTEAGIQSNFSPMPFVVSAVGSVLTAFVLQALFTRLGVRGWRDGMMSGAAIGFFGLIGTMVSYQFAFLPMSLAFIDGGYAFVLFVVYGKVIGWWNR